MKLKNLSIVFALLGVVLLGFSSCSDDDDDKTPPIEWDGTAKTYTYTDTNLKINDVNSNNGATVVINGISDEAAKITLTNVVVGEAKLEMNATLRRNGNDYLVEASNSNADRDITIKGNIVDKTMNATVTTKIKSPIVGNWTLKMTTNDKNVKVADLITRLYFGEDEDAKTMQDYILEQLADQDVSGEGLAKAVESVNVSFEENGVLGIKYKDTKPGSGEVSLSKFVNLHYYTNSANHKVYIAVDKKTITDLVPILQGLLGKDVDINKLLGLFEVNGDSYAIPLNYSNKGNHTDFYITKDYIAKIVNAANESGLITKYDKDGSLQMMVALVTGLAAKEDVVIDLGLGFDKK